MPNGVAIENDVYCAILTNTSYEDRILHEMRDEEYPTNIVLMASGNNLQIGGELSVRTLVCYIDSRCKHPEKRNFFKIKNWEEYMQQQRAELIVDHITIMWAYLLACQQNPALVQDPGQTGKPLEPWGGFEVWDEIIRRALIWVGMPDPCESRWQDDHHKEEGTSIAHELARAFPEEFTQAQACEEINEKQHERLRDAIPLRYKDRQGMVILEKFRYWFRDNRNRPMGDWTVVKLTQKHGGSWKAIPYKDLAQWIQPKKV